MTTARSAADAWREFCETHIRPSELLSIASGLEPLTADKAKHLSQCDSCLKAFNVYEVGPDSAIIAQALATARREAMEEAARLLGEMARTHESRYFEFDADLSDRSKLPAMREKARYEILQAAQAAIRRAGEGE